MQEVFDIGDQFRRVGFQFLIECHRLGAVLEDLCDFIVGVHDHLELSFGFAIRLFVFTVQRKCDSGNNLDLLFNG